MHPTLSSNRMIVSSMIAGQWSLITYHNFKSLNLLLTWKFLKQLRNKKQQQQKNQSNNTSVWCFVIKFTNFLCNILVYLSGNDSCLLRHLIEAIRQAKEASHALKAHRWMSQCPVYFVHYNCHNFVIQLTLLM